MGYLLGNVWSGGARDAMSAALVSLSASTWSADLVESGLHLSDVVPAVSNAEYRYPGETGTLPGVTGEVMAYSGGCYLDGLKKYMLPGSGGHGNWLGTQICVLDNTTLKWSLTEHSCRYLNGTKDPSAPFATPDQTQGWYPYENAAGRRSAIACHKYGFPEYCPDINLVFTHGRFSWPQAEGVGGYFCATEDGLWDQDHAFATPTGFQAGSSEGVGLWVPEQFRVFTTGNEGHGSLLDPLTNDCTQTHRSDITDAKWDSGGNSGLGCIVDDPLNAGHRAYIGFCIKSFNGGVEALAVYPKVDTLPGTPLQTAFLAFNDTVPTALTTHNGVFIEGAKYKAGSTKVIIVDLDGSGIYLLDMATLTFSGPLTGSELPISITTGQYGFKIAHAIGDYADSTYLPIGLIDPTTGGLYAYKLPKSDL